VEAAVFSRSFVTRLGFLTRRRCRFLAAGAGILTVALVLSAVDPGPARALSPGLPGPGQVVGGLLGGIGNAIGGTVGSLAVKAFEAIIHALFAPIAHFINTQLIGWLVAVPDYAPPGSHVAATEQTILVMAGAALAAVGTVSIARFWAAGVAGNGGSALDGLARTVGAALLLPLWPWVFHAAVALANQASTGLLGSVSVTRDSANLLALGVGAGVGLGFAGAGLFVSIVMAVVASVLFLGLLMMKVVLAISTVLVFIGMPIAIVLWPAMPWVARVLGRAFGVCLAVPLVWSMCFAAAGAMLNDGLLVKGSSGFFDALLEPLAAIALLWIMLALPSKLAHLAMLGASSLGGGFVSRTASYAAGSQLRDVTRQHMPGWAGGGPGRGQQQATSLGTESRLGARLGAESVLAASRVAAAGAATAGAGGLAAGAASAGTGGGSAAAQDGSARQHGATNGASNGSAEYRSGWLGRVRGGGTSNAYSPPPLAGSQAEIAARGGLQRPSWRQEDFDAEMLEASLREQREPVSIARAEQARDALPTTTRAAVGALVGEHGPRARQHLAYQALGAWTPQEREAIRTLAAASHDVRLQAFTDASESMAGFGAGSEPTPSHASGDASQAPARAGGPTVQPGRSRVAPPMPPPTPTQQRTEGGNGAATPREAHDQTPPPERER
jgi:hypothetical protein